MNVETIVRTGLDAADGEVAITGLIGESCTEACRRVTLTQGGQGGGNMVHVLGSSHKSPRWRCSDHLLGLLHRNCGRLKRLLGCKSCRYPRDPRWKGEDGKWVPLEHLDFLWQTVSPGRPAKSSQCFLSSAKFLSCDAVAPATHEFHRACVCTESSSPRLELH